MRAQPEAQDRRAGAVDLALVVNTKAREATTGELTSASLERKLVQRGWHVRVAVVGSDEDTAELAERLAREGARVVVAVGGDGTVHGVAVGLYRAGGVAALGIIPAGTMNNVAAALGIPEDVDAAVDLLSESLASGIQRPLDLGLALDHPFVESVGFGIVSDLLGIGESVKQRALSAPAAISRLAGLIARYRPAPITLILDGHVHRARALHVLICNAPVTGLRILAAPNARLDDGFLDVVIYEQLRPIELLAYIVRKIGGKRIPNARVRRYRAREIVVAPSQVWPIDLDGDLIGECGPGTRRQRIEARVAPAALRVCAPPRHKRQQPQLAESALQTVLRALPGAPEDVPAAVEQVAAAAEHAVAEAALTAEHAVVEAAAAASEALEQVTEPPRRAARRATVIRGLYLAGSAVALAASIAVRRLHVLPGDVELTRALQRSRSPFLDRFWTAVAWAGFPRESTSIVAATTLGLWLARFPLEAAFFVLASGVNVANFVIKRVVRRQRPTDTVVQVMRLIREPGFPSGHVMLYTSTLGFLAAAALANLRPSPLRRVIVGACGALIGLVGPSRVYLGAHWPSDVAAGYIFGGLYLGGVLELYASAKRRQAQTAE